MNKVPVILLGGEENSLSITRNFGAKNIPVILAANSNCRALKSKYCYEKLVAKPGSCLKNFWEDMFLIQQKYSQSILFSCCDEGVEFIAENHHQLKKNYILDHAIPSLHLAMIDKYQTLKLAKKAGCNVPNYWEISSPEEIEPIKNEIQFPIIIKPKFSHLFQQQFQQKFFFIHNVNDLLKKAQEVHKANLDYMLVEKIPGPDNLLSSYYTYIDEQDNILFSYTKSIIRRSPMNMGGATFHLSKWYPETASSGKKFFKNIGYRGIGNVEFKLDQRDGKLKLIECNPRFTAAQELLRYCGAELDFLIYCNLIGTEFSLPKHYKENIYLWDPYNDFFAFRELRKNKLITLSHWLKSLMCKKIYCYANLNDPKPFIHSAIDDYKSICKGISKKFLGSS